MPQHQTIVESYSGRLRLIPPDAAYDEIASVYRTHPETLKHLRLLPDKLTVEEVRIRREERAEDPQIVDFYAFTVGPDGQRTENLVAMTAVFNIDTKLNTCEIGILVSPGRQRAGYGTEVLYCMLRYIFEERKFHQATFETSVDNIPMQKWLEKTGVRLEAERKEFWPSIKGGYDDVKGYAVLDWEWRDRVKANLEERIQARWSL